MNTNTLIEELGNLTTEEMHHALQALEEKKREGMENVDIVEKEAQAQLKILLQGYIKEAEAKAKAKADAEKESEKTIVENAKKKAKMEIAEKQNFIIEQQKKLKNLEELLKQQSKAEAVKVDLTKSENSFADTVSDSDGAYIIDNGEFWEWADAIEYANELGLTQLEAFQTARLMESIPRNAPIYLVKAENQTMGVVFGIEFNDISTEIKKARMLTTNKRIAIRQQVLSYEKVLELLLRFENQFFSSEVVSLDDKLAATKNKKNIWSKMKDVFTVNKKAQNEVYTMENRWVSELNEQERKEVLKHNKRVLNSVMESVSVMNFAVTVKVHNLDAFEY